MDENWVVLNSTLPYVREVLQKRSPNIITPIIAEYSLLKGMYFACVFIESNFANSWTFFANLFHFDGTSSEN